MRLKRNEKFKELGGPFKRKGTREKQKSRQKVALERKRQKNGTFEPKASDKGKTAES